jgi:RND family efflux transporter MFP subunit
VGVPTAILLAAAALLMYAAWDALTPAIEVRVSPAVLKEGAYEPSTVGASSPDRVVAQGPGWIEAAPYPITIQALAEGVVSEVLVLEGDRVKAGQIVARMIDDDARLEVDRAQSELEIARAEADQARAAASAADTRAEDVRDELERKSPLASSGGISEGQLARLELRLRALEHDAAAASAAERAARASVSREQTLVGQAELRLARMEIRSPSDGVVLSRAVEPGTRVALTGPGPGEGHGPGLFRVYDPASLQVRVDVPLADASKVSIGARAEVVTEAMGDHAFRGEVSHIIHEADIQRNTVEVKVRIDDPLPILKPEMLARVRFFAAHTDAVARIDTAGATGQPTRLLVPTAALFDASGEEARVWVVDRGSERKVATAAIRVVRVAGVEGDHALVSEGLRLGDRVILDPPQSLTEGARVRVASTVN